VKSGEAFEQQAADWLSQRGLSLLARNFHCRFGELDLVMLEDQTLVFVEVRQRSHSQFGGAAASVTASKQRKLIHAANWFLGQHPEHQSRNCRFDVLAFEPIDTQCGPMWYKDAFRL